jgi:hypothetical protein
MSPQCETTRPLIRCPVPNQGQVQARGGTAGQKWASKSHATPGRRHPRPSADKPERHRAARYSPAHAGRSRLGNAGRCCRPGHVGRAALAFLTAWHGISQRNGTVLDLTRLLVSNRRSLEAPQLQLSHSRKREYTVLNIYRSFWFRPIDAIALLPIALGDANHSSR